MNFNSRLPRHHLQVAQTLRATGTLYILLAPSFERKNEDHHQMTNVPAPCSAEATGMPEEKHSTGKVVFRRIGILQEHPFGHLQNCLDYSISPHDGQAALGSNATLPVPLQDTSRK